jgi:hypothetical protein
MNVHLLKALVQRIWRGGRIVLRTRFVMPTQHALETFLPGACGRTVDDQPQATQVQDLERPTDIPIADTHCPLLKVNINV